jgi:dolichol-phosphate mannosyltransferase
MLLSIVIPVYNEEETIPLLLQQILSTLPKFTDDFELIFVDDGSTDSSLNFILGMRHRDHRIKAIALSRNFGHQAAYTAGLHYAKGEYIVMMDGDLQDPPELIEPMYKKLTVENYDIVFGRRSDRNESFFKQKLIKAFHKLFNKASNINAPENVGNFSIMTRKAMEAFLELNEKNRYLPGLRFFIGFNQGFYDFERPDRKFGLAKMSYTKLFKLAFDALFSFSNFPLKFCFYTGIFGVIIFFIAGSISLVHKIIGIASPGWSSTLISIYFLGSIQLLFLGIIGEYVYRIYVEVQNRPIYIVKDVYDS